jgi:hypothetical protein
MRHLIVSILILLGGAQQSGCSTGHAIYGTEYQIQGTLVDGATRAPLARERVLLDEGGKSLRVNDSGGEPRTDEQGRFIVRAHGSTICRPTGGLVGLFSSAVEAPPLRALNIQVICSDGNARNAKIDIATAQQSHTKDGVRFVKLGLVAVP